MLLKGSGYSAPMHHLIFLAVTLILSFVFTLDAIHHGTAQNEQETSYSVNIRMGASVPSMGATPQPFYDPPVLPINPKEKIPVKSTVSWINDDESYHTVTSGDPLTGPDRLFDSGILSPKASYSYTFNNPGEYNYYCTVHPFMRGLVKVTG
jgi:plastocyanin